MTATDTTMTTATTSGTTATTATTTTTTVIAVRGSLQLEVDNPEEFVRDEGVREALGKRLALIAGTTPDRVLLEMSVTSARRSLRRLAATGVEISFTIIVDSPEEAVAAHDAVGETVGNAEQLTALVTEAVAEGSSGGGTAYTIAAVSATVADLPPEHVATTTTTTTTTTTATATAEEGGGGGGGSGAMVGGIVGALVALTACGAAAAYCVHRSHKPRAPPPHGPQVTCKSCSGTGTDVMGNACHCYKKPMRPSEAIALERREKGWKRMSAAAPVTEVYGRAMQDRAAPVEPGGDTAAAACIAPRGQALEAQAEQGQASPGVPPELDPSTPQGAAAQRKSRGWDRLSERAAEGEPGGEAEKTGKKKKKKKDKKDGTSKGMAAKAGMEASMEAGIQVPAGGKKKRPANE